MNAQRKTKRLELANVLESAILNGRLKPGMRLIELQLAKEFHVSQTSVREALQDLERAGLVVKNSNRGSYVIDLSSEDLIHIYQLRRELEPMACGFAAGCLKQTTLDSLGNCLARMRQAVKKSDTKAYLAADLCFHRVIWDSQPNPYLQKALTTLCLPLFAYELVERQAGAPMDFGKAIRRHELIMTALKTGDPARVAKLMRRLTDRFLHQDLTEFAHSGRGAEASGSAPPPRRLGVPDRESSERPAAAWPEPSGSEEV